MNEPTIELPGFEHLRSTCQANHLRLEMWPPQVEALRPGGSLLGQPFDPLLATLSSRINGGWLGELLIYPNDNSLDEGLVPFNQYQRKYASPQLREVLYYLTFNGMPYYMATVPSLADGNGIQPVLYVVLDITIVVMPIASSVDKAFDLYARYLEALVQRYGSVQAGEDALGLAFPFDFASFVATDWKLVQMLERNAFAAFEAVDPTLSGWRSSILRAVEGRT